MQWLGLLLRWAHVIAALAWIGASFYLISWENKFNRKHDLRDGIEGDFWTIQGGDFYFVEKLAGAPDRLPRKLHWFKYEAYLTWITGFVLTCVVFYTNAASMMLRPASPLSNSMQAIGFSLGSLVLCVFIYALYCRVSWARNLRLSAVIGLIGVAALAWLFCQVFNGRAAFIQLGAVIGTIMSANVFFSIIPWHKRLIRAIESGAPVEPLYGSHPGFRSRHNHYMTLPVLMLMLASHAPFATDGNAAWITATLLVAGAGLVKHAHTRVQKAQPMTVSAVLGLGVFIAAAWVASGDTVRGAECDSPVSDIQIAETYRLRCAACHVPGIPGIKVPIDGPRGLRAQRDAVYARVIQQRDMPPQNATGLTTTERHFLGCWLNDETPPAP